MEKNKERNGLGISVKSFISAIVVIFILMIVTYMLTMVIPGGEYARITDESGNVIIDTAGGFQQVEGGIPFWKWILSPILVLGASGNGTLIAVIAFLLVIGGAFNGLEKCGLMKYMLDKIVYRFGEKRYNLMAIIILFFMIMGSFIGSFEECVPLVPMVVALAAGLGWDSLTGMGMSLLAAGCGFAAGVCNPFTVGVAQKLAGLPMFSGIWLRAVGFVLIYALLFIFVRSHAKKVEKPLSETAVGAEFKNDKKLNKGLLCFVGILGAGLLLVLSSSFITVLQDYTMIIVAVMFLVAGLTSVNIAGLKGKALAVTFKDGVVSVLPAVFMILMASSIKYTMEEAKILDTILHATVGVAETLPKWTVILFIYLIVLIMNFFISSGSAKAILIIPLIVPMAQIFGISPQLCVLAYAFGDGFSNVFYPTNPVLLISLGVANVSYVDWVKWTWKFQTVNFVMTSMILLFGMMVGY